MQAPKEDVDRICNGLCKLEMELPMLAPEMRKDAKAVTKMEVSRNLEDIDFNACCMRLRHSIYIWTWIRSLYICSVDAFHQ